MNARRQTIISEMRDNPNITTAELHKLLSISETAIEKNISLASLKHNSCKVTLSNVMERYSAIKEAKELISTLENEKKRTTALCPKCGAKTSIDMKYCGVCGANMKDEAE